MYPVHKKSMSKTANRNYLLVDAEINYQIRCLQISGEASPTIWSCYANFSVFIDRIRNQFLKK